MSAHTPSEPPPPPRSRGSLTPSPRTPGCLTPISALVVGAIAIFAMATGLLAGRCSAPSTEAPAPPATVLKATPSVVVAIRDLARLEAANYHIERVIDLKENQSRLFGLLKAEDAILLVAAGDVSAGVDFARLSEEDIRVDPDKRTATIRLPAAEILSTRLDNERTYVHTRTTDVLAVRKESLETRARREAERSIGQAALDAGILERAERNAQRAVEALVRSLGYQHVQVTFKKPKLEE